MGVAVTAAAVGFCAHATSAAPLSPTTTLDVTYSCRVQKAKVADISASARSPKDVNPSAPGELSFDTGIERKTVGGTTTTKAQASVVPRQHGVTIDKKNCQKLKTQISLSTKKLPVFVSATPSFRGYTSQVCDTTSTRVIFRLQVHMTGGKPTDAVLALRNADAKRKPIALVSWRPKKVVAHFSRACTALG